MPSAIDRYSIQMTRQKLMKRYARAQDMATKYRQDGNVGQENLWSIECQNIKDELQQLTDLEKT